MNKKIGPAASVVVVVLMLMVVIGVGWYFINPPPGPIGPKPGADTGMRHPGDGKTGPGGFKHAPGRNEPPH